MQDFFCETDAIAEIKDKVIGIKEILDSTYEKAEAVMQSVSDEKIWNGMSQQTGMAFLDLTMQYHKSLAGDPLSQAQAALESIFQPIKFFMIIGKIIRNCVSYRRECQYEIFGFRNDVYDQCIEGKKTVGN